MLKHSKIATQVIQKQKIVDRFSSSVEYYDQHAGLQKETAHRMARSLDPWRYSVPEGSVLEIGAGTGFFTEYLIRLYPDREMTITDISVEMVERCRQEWHERRNLHFDVLDAESDEWPEETWALIAGNFVIQWFQQPGTVLAKMIRALKPGGLLLMSFPGSESYPQWKKYCMELGLPFTGNPLPDVEQLIIQLSMGPVQVDFFEDQTSEQYEDLYAFFRHLKKSGTSTSFSGKKLTPKQLKLLNDYWLQQNSGKVTVHYHTVFLAAKKNL